MLMPSPYWNGGMINGVQGFGDACNGDANCEALLSDPMSYAALVGANPGLLPQTGILQVGNLVAASNAAGGYLTPAFNWIPWAIGGVGALLLFSSMGGRRR